jgi:diamine N-acetyltransferase
MSIEIKKVKNEFEECTNVIRNSFITVADEFGITRENAPSNPAFVDSDALIKMREKGIELYAAYENGQCVGFVADRKSVV